MIANACLSIQEMLCASYLFNCTELFCMTWPLEYQNEKWERSTGVLLTLVYKDQDRSGKCAECRFTDNKMNII